MKLKYMLAVGAILFSCTASAQTAAGIAAYNSSPSVGKGHMEARYIRTPNAEEVKGDRRAAESGDASAQKNLGAMYGKGQGVPQNSIEAYVWSSIAANSGDEGAMNNRDFAASKLSTEDLETALKRAAELYEEIQQRQG